MQRVMKRDDIVNEVAERTGFYKKNIREILEVFEEIVVENMNEATYTEPSELYLTHGFVIGAKRFPEREVRDPRNQNKVITPEKVIPYAKFKASFRHRINE